MLHNYLLKLYVFFVGLCFGSFLNVCIYRLPLEQSIIKPSSFCPKCKNKLKWYHNIPLISYLFLAGKCAYCGSKISIKYPLIEFLTGVIFYLNYYFYGISFQSFFNVIFIMLLLIVVFVDLEHMIIPDEVSVGGIGAGFILSFFNKNISWIDSLLGIVIGGGILLAIIKGYYLLTKKEGMGGGDVKLLAMIGAFLGYKSILFVIFVSSLIGTVTGVPLMLIKGEKSDLAIPFGPFLSLGAIIYLFFGSKIISWYFNFLKG